MVLWEFLFHPVRYAQGMAAHPPIGAVTLWLALAALLWITGIGGRDAWHSWNGNREELSTFGLVLLCILPVFLAIWLLLSFLTFGILRGVGHPLSFEAVFCLLALAFTPKLLHWLAFPLRESISSLRYIWHAISLVLFPTTVWCLWGVFSSTGHVSGWRALCIVAPGLVLLLSATLLDLFAPPMTPRAAYPWRRAGGNRVVVFHPAGKPREEVEQIVMESDQLMVQIEQLLEVKSLSFRVAIFLCAGPEDLGRLSKHKEQNASGYAYRDAIILVYHTWQEIRGTAAHELTHTVAMQRLHPHLMPLLNEGLAQYGEAQTIGDVHAAICLPLTLGTLAHSSVFYDWLYVKAPDYPPNTKYSHASALADYLIGHYGMEKFKQLCVQTAITSDKNQAAQLHKAVDEIYGLSLHQLEQNWRREWVGFGQIEVV